MESTGNKTGSENSSALEKLTRITPLIAAFLIFLGSLRLSFYYQHWNINIFNYLDFSEIILSFINDLNILIFFITLFLFQTLLTLGINQHFKKRKEASTGQLNAETNLEKELSEMEKHPKTLLIIFIVLTFLFCGLFLWTSWMIFLYLTFISFVQLLFYVLDKFLGIKEVEPSLFLSFIIITVLFTFTISKHEVMLTEKNIKQAVIYTETDTISTNKTKMYLGKTNNFFYFYDKETNQKIIYPINEVKKVTIIN
jgi:hypothetical protein